MKAAAAQRGLTRRIENSTADQARAMSDETLASATQEALRVAKVDGNWSDFYTYGAEQARRENARMLAEHKALGGAIRPARR
jgi:hypothetical protein